MRYLWTLCCRRVVLLQSLRIVGYTTLLFFCVGTANAAPLYFNDTEIDYLVGGDISMTSASTTNPWVNGSFTAIQVYLGASASTSIRYTLYDGNTESNHKDCSSGVVSVSGLGAPVSGSITYSDLVLVTIPMSGTECTLTDATGGFDEDYTSSEAVGAEFALLGTGMPEYFKVLAGSADACGPETMVCDFTPANGEVMATSSTRDGVDGATSTIEVYYYIAEEDVGTFTGISTKISQDDQNGVLHNTVDLLSTIGPTEFTYICDTLLDNDIPCNAGLNHFSRDIWLPVGNYIVHVSLQHSLLTIVNPFTGIFNAASESQDNSVKTAQYHQYQVGGGTYLGRLRQSTTNQLENILVGDDSTTTPSIDDCSVLDFQFKDCMTFAFIPTTNDIKKFGSTISVGVLSKFPVGYVWNFYTILLSSTTAALPVIDATIPDGVAGAGSHIRLEITSDTLSYLMNATTSRFTNASAPSTQSFASIVGYYWNILVYIGVGGYILSRVMGSHVIGSLWAEETQPIRSLSARYKEYRGNKDVRRMKITDNSNYTQQEWKNAKDNRLM